MSKEAERIAAALYIFSATQRNHNNIASQAAALLRRQAEQIKELREALIAMDEATKGKFGDLEFMAMASQKTGAALSNTKEES